MCSYGLALVSTALVLIYATPRPEAATLFSSPLLSLLRLAGTRGGTAHWAPSEEVGTPRGTDRAAAGGGGGPPSAQDVGGRPHDVAEGRGARGNSVEGRGSSGTPRIPRRATGQSATDEDESQKDVEGELAAAGLRLPSAEGAPERPSSEEKVQEDDSNTSPEYELLQCLIKRARKAETQKKKAKRNPKLCHTKGTRQKGAGGGSDGGGADGERSDCLPSLLLVFPTLCNDTKLCVNVTEASLDSLLHRHWLWKRKNKRREESQEAVVYIVVVLAFYSFGIVFMMANFIRQEQREIEETKLYKQYIKVARDRWLTTRGNLANKLALQALNTLNAVPQTTNVSKVTFV